MDLRQIAASLASLDSDLAFDALTAAEGTLNERLAFRWKLGKEFSSPEALKEYLRKHPKSDAKNHTVKKKDDAADDGEKKPKAEKPKADMSDIHPTDQNYDAIKKLREKKLREQAKEKK